MRIASLMLATACLAAPALQAAPLNDTGITGSGHAVDGNSSTCDSGLPAGQDCHYGRDKAAADNTLAKVGASSLNNGVANGFDFSKISNSGHVLDASATLGSGANDWACTRDNVTGLIWEVKVNDAAHLRHQSHTYTWYLTGSPDGKSGTASGGTCKDTGRCDTEKYVADVNATKLCGYADWRMPTVKELEGIVDFGRSNPAIDTTYFPNTPSSYVWSGSRNANDSSNAWGVNFNYGNSSYNYRNVGNRVRLVRAGQ